MRLTLKPMESYLMQYRTRHVVNMMTIEDEMMVRYAGAVVEARKRLAYATGIQLPFSPFHAAQALATPPGARGVGQTPVRSAARGTEAQAQCDDCNAGRHVLQAGVQGRPDRPRATPHVLLQLARPAVQLRCELRHDRQSKCIALHSSARASR